MVSGCGEKRFQPYLQECVNTLMRLQDVRLCAPGCQTSWWIRHVPREFNTRADELAKTCLLSGAPYTFCFACEQRPIAISVHFDGGHEDGRGSSAWTMSCAMDDSYQLQIIAEAATYHKQDATSVSAEMIACWQALRALEQYVLHRSIQFDADGSVQAA